MEYKGKVKQLPDHMQEAMIRYIENGIEPGSFLIAVLENNLTMAVMKADCINVYHLVDYVQYLTWHAPSNCHGSTSAVESWIKAGGLRGLGYDLE